MTSTPTLLIIDDDRAICAICCAKTTVHGSTFAPGVAVAKRAAGTWHPAKRRKKMGQRRHRTAPAG